MTLGTKMPDHTIEPPNEMTMQEYEARAMLLGGRYGRVYHVIYVREGGVLATKDADTLKVVRGLSLDRCLFDKTGQRIGRRFAR